MYDLIIIGGGPAGLTAAVYAIQKRLETLIISEDWGGKANYRMSVPGTEGYEVIKGAEVVDRFKRQIQYLDFVRHRAAVDKIEAVDDHYLLHTDDGRKFEARALVVATGATPRQLGLPDEERLIGHGLSYSAVSHASLFFGKDVAIIGSGPIALRGAAELATVARQVTVVALEPGDLDSPLGMQLHQSPHVDILTDVEVVGIPGGAYVEGVKLRTKDGVEKEVVVDGVFIELGLVPNSNLVKGLVELDAEGRIVVDCASQTNHPGIFAAGDVTTTHAEQVLIATGDGAKAALSAYEYLLTHPTFGRHNSPKETLFADV
jgi:alkyl hydroperoxide reductase subunit F